MSLLDSLICSSFSDRLWIHITANLMLCPLKLCCHQCNTKALQLWSTLSFMPCHISSVYYAGIHISIHFLHFFFILNRFFPTVICQYNQHQILSWKQMVTYPYSSCALLSWINQDCPHSFKIFAKSNFFYFITIKSISSFFLEISPSTGAQASNNLLTYSLTL